MNKIYVGNLPYQVTQPEIEGAFQQYGEIKEVALIKDRFSNEFKGFGFVTFASSESAQASLEMDGKDFMGRPIKVSIAREPEKRSGGGGGSRGGFGGGRPSHGGGGRGRPGGGHGGGGHGGGNRDRGGRGGDRGDRGSW